MNRIPPKTGTRTPAEAPAPVENASVDLTSNALSSVPSLPHERDESVGMTGGLPSGAVQQGARDVKRGLEDTSRAPEADRAYRKLKK